MSPDDLHKSLRFDLFGSGRLSAINCLQILLLNPRQPLPQMDTSMQLSLQGGKCNFLYTPVNNIFILIDNIYGLLIRYKVKHKSLSPSQQPLCCAHATLMVDCNNITICDWKRLCRLRFCHLRLRQQPATVSLMLQEMKASAKLFGPFYDGRGDGGFSTTL